MVSLAYNEYKQSVLNALSSGNKYFKYNGNKYHPTYYKKDIPDFNDIIEKSGHYNNNTMDSIVVGYIDLFEDETGKVYGEEFLKDTFKNGKLAGRLLSDTYSRCYLANSFGFKSCGVVSDGQIVYGGDTFKYSNKCNVFCVKYIDDDGIVVMPPDCTFLICMIEQEAKKIKQIISCGSISIIPGVAVLDEGTKLDRLEESDIKVIDSTNIEYNVYAEEGIDGISFKIKTPVYYGKLKNNQNISGYEFRCINLYYKSHHSKLYLSSAHSTVNIYHEIADDSPDKEECNLEVKTEYSDCKSVINYNCNKSDIYCYVPRIENFDSNRLHLNINSSNPVKWFFLGYDKNNIRNTDKYNNTWDNIECSFNIKQNDIIYMNFNKTHSPKDIEYPSKYNFGYYFDSILDKAYNYIHNDIKIYFVEKIVSLQDIDNTITLGIDELANYLFATYMSVWYKNSISLEDINNMKYKDLYLSALNKSFGLCKSSYGDLSAVEAIERFCTGEFVTFSEMSDVSIKGTMGMGVTIDLNIYQLYILRMFGLKSNHFITMKDTIVYGVKKFKEQGYRYPITCGECVILNEESDDALGFYCYHTKNYLVYSSEFKYEFTYGIIQNNRTRYYSVKRYNDYLSLHPCIESTTLNNIKLLKTVYKKSVIEQDVIKHLLKEAVHSKSAGLYGGKELVCTKCERTTLSKISEGVIMDNVFSSSDYCIFTLKDSDNKVYEVEESTLLKLLEDNSVYCDDLNYTLIPDHVIYMRDDFDKEATRLVEDLKLSNMALNLDSKNDLSLSHMSFYPGAVTNTYELTCRNIGDEIALPSFVYGIYSDIDEQELKRIGLELGNTDEIDVSKRIKSLLGDTIRSSNSTAKEMSKPLTTSLARNKGMEFYCSEHCVYKDNKPFKIASMIHNSLLELPRKMGICFCYPYRSYSGYLDGDVIQMDRKVHVRPLSTIYELKTATEVEVDESCTIQESAFSNSGLRKLVLHSDNSLPSDACKNCLDLESVIVDGSNISINVSAFNGCKSFKGIECVNGGQYTLIDAHNENALNKLISEGNSEIPFYKSILDSYKEADDRPESVMDVIPYSINIDNTVTLKSKDGSEIKYTLDGINKLYNEGLLNFVHSTKSGKSVSFIQKLKYSGLNCLVFYPGINNSLCKSKLLLVLDNFALASLFKEFKNYTYTFAFEEDDWKNGGVKDLPYKFIAGKKIGFYFDNDEDTKDYIVHSFCNNLNYLDTKWYSFYDYYTNGRSLSSLPVDDKWFLYKSNSETLYFPASHELDYQNKMLECTKDNKNEIKAGASYKYGKFYHSKKYYFPIGSNVEIIPGIGENKLFHLYPAHIKWSDYLLWNESRVLTIRSESILEPFALFRYYDYDGSVMNAYMYPIILRIYKNTKLHIYSDILSDCEVYDCGLILDFENMRGLTVNYINECKNSFIGLIGEKACLEVINFEEKYFDTFYENAMYNFLYQIIQHAVNREDLLKVDRIKKFIDECDSGTIGVVDEVKKLHISDSPIDLTPTQYNTTYDYMDESIDWEEVEAENEPDASEIDEVALSLEAGEIPDIMSMDYIADNIDNQGEQDSISCYLGLDNNDESEDFLTLSVNSDNIESANLLTSMCGVDVEGLASQEDLVNGIESDVEEVVREIMWEKEAQEAKEQQQGLLDKLSEENKIKNETLEDSTSVVKAKNKRKSRKKELDKYKLESLHKEEPVESSKDAEIEDSIFNLKREELQDKFMSSDSSKSKGLASYLLSELAQSYKSKEVTELLVLEPVMRGSEVLGYLVENQKTKESKRLSLSNLEKLSNSGKYKVIGL